MAVFGLARRTGKEVAQEAAERMVKAAKKMRLHHYSNSPDLDVIDPAYYGRGMRGEELERVQFNDAPARSYAYTDQRMADAKAAGLEKPEPGVGDHLYDFEVDADSIYNWADDPDGIVAKAWADNTTPDKQTSMGVLQGSTNRAQAKTDAEKMIKAAGYDGYESGGSVAFFSPKRVAELATGLAGGVTVLAPEEAEAGVIKEGVEFIGDTVRRVGEFDPRFDPRKKEAERLAELETTVEETDPDAPEIKLADLEGQPFVTSMSDRTAAGGLLKRINEVDLDTPTPLRGGQDFMFHNPGEVWASARNPAMGILRAARKAKAETGQDPLYLPWRMAPTGSDFSTMTGRTMLAYASANMGKGVKRSLNARIKKMIPDWKGVDDPGSLDQFSNAPDSVRKELKNMMDTQFRDRGGLSIGEARLAIADPEQLVARDMGVQSVGRILADDDVRLSTHPDYPYAVPGEGLGVIREDVGVLELLPDIVEERGVPDPLNPRNTDQRAMQMGAKTGVIDEKVLRSLEERGVDVGAIDPKLLGATATASTAAAAYKKAREEKQERRENFLAALDVGGATLSEVLGPYVAAVVNMGISSKIGIRGAAKRSELFREVFDFHDLQTEKGKEFYEDTMDGTAQMMADYLQTPSGIALRKFAKFVSPAASAIMEQYEKLSEDQQAIIRDMADAL